MFLVKRFFPIRDGVYAVDTIRACAILLVVLYHVIGSDSATGLGKAPPDPLRNLADILNDIHMPVFAAMSGLVYAMKPATWAVLSRFLWGKMLRLAMPGLVAISVFAIALQGVDTGFTLPSPLWTLMFYPFLHFWFLQALMVVLAVTAITDCVTRGRSAWLTFPVGGAALAASLDPGTDFMAFPGAIWLLPYFAVGQLLWRYQGWIQARKRLVCVLALAGIVVGLGLDLWQIADTGRVVGNHSAPENILLSTAICLGLVAIPSVRWIAWLAVPSFAIYLYHPLATSAMRRALYALGTENPGLHVILGVVAGVALPLLVYVAASQHLRARHLVLGQGNPAAAT